MREEEEEFPQEDDREVLGGYLSHWTKFRLVVNGSFGVKEIERLIRKLEIDKEILADKSDLPDALADQ